MVRLTSELLSEYEESRVLLLRTFVVCQTGVKGMPSVWKLRETGMDDERYSAIAAIITSADLDEPADWQEYPELRVELDRLKTLLGPCRRYVHDAFPEWHFPDGQFVGNYRRHWGHGDSARTKSGLHSVVCEVWQCASTGDTDVAKGLLVGLSRHFSRRAKKAQGRDKEVLTLMSSLFRRGPL